MNEELFKSQCETIGGKYNKHKSTSTVEQTTTYHNCKIEDEGASPLQQEGETRTLQWIQNKDAQDKATVYVNARGGGTIFDPERTEVSVPDEIAERSAESVGVSARKTLTVTDRHGQKVKMKGTGVQ